MKHPVLNMLDWGTNRQVCAIVDGDFTSHNVLKTFMHERVKH